MPPVLASAGSRLIRITSGLSLGTSRSASERAARATAGRAVCPRVGSRSIQLSERCRRLRKPNDEIGRVRKLNDKLTAADVHLEREHLDKLCDVHGVFLYSNCAKTVSF